MTDSFNLDRFVQAQKPIYNQAIQELRDGEKRTHWIWYVFPQLKGLGKSSTADFYGISSAAEARAYFHHSLLGARLVECNEAVLDLGGLSLNAIFGSPDDMKFKSCMTLFASVASDSCSLFKEALDKYCDGQMDQKTIELLSDAH